VSIETAAIDFLKEGGSLAVLGVVLWAIANKALPAFLDALRDQRTEFIQALDRNEDLHERTITKIAIEHRETVRQAQAANDRQMAKIAEKVEAQTELMRQVIRSRKCDHGSEHRRASDRAASSS